MADSRRLGFGPIAAPAGGVLVVFADDSLRFGTRTRAILGSAADLVAKAAKSERFTGKNGSALDIVALGGFLVPSRISVAMTCVGLAGRALDLAVEYSKKRETFGKPIASRQAIAFRLAEMAADFEVINPGREIGLRC